VEVSLPAALTHTGKDLPKLVVWAVCGSAEETHWTEQRAARSRKGTSITGV